MSVYINIHRHELEQFLLQFDVGQLIAYEAIESGITNSNYLVMTDKTKFILTLFEELTADDLPFYVDLMTFLSQHNIPCPTPISDKQHNVIHQLHNRPCVMVEHLPGQSITRPELHHCVAVGDLLGRLHVAGLDFPQKKANTRGSSWKNEAVEQLLNVLPVQDALLLQEEFGFHKTQKYDVLPQGIIHADLFPDNILFTDHKLTGVIDFYYACTDNLLLDVAIAVHAWCQDGQGNFNEDYVAAFIASYEQHRVLTPMERKHWQGIRRTAALRFWLSRLLDTYFPPQGEKILTKDPNEYKLILLQLSEIPNL